MNLADKSLILKKDNFQYIGADAFLTGGVSWAMVFRWDWLSRHEMETMDHTVGLKSPTIAGGLFSVGIDLICRHMSIEIFR